MMRQITSKKIQIPQNSQNLFLAKCFVEQKLEAQMKKVTISLKGNPDGTVFFKIVQTKEIAAIAKDSKVYVFANPVKDFKALPLDTTLVSLCDIVKTDGVMRCRKCKSWMQDAAVSKCPCGGYLQKRKRFHLRDETTEALDAEYLEIQTALNDIRTSAKIDCRPTSKQYIPTGMISTSVAGKASTETNTEPRMLTRVSAQGAEWLEEFGMSPLGQNVVIRKIDGFNIPPNDEAIQVSLRANLIASFSSEVNN